MKISIIGKGNVGSALAAGWARKGHDVTIGVRSPGDASLKNETSASVRFASVEEALAGGEVIVLTLPPAATVEVAQLIAKLPDAKGRTIIDASNSLFQKPAGYESAYHALREITGNDAVKCFNTTGAENMANPAYAGGALDMFMCGGDAERKTAVRSLALDLGFAECYDAGGPDAAGVLEQFAGLWIRFAMKQGLGRNFGFRIVKR